MFKILLIGVLIFNLILDDGFESRSFVEGVGKVCFDNVSYYGYKLEKIDMK